MLKNLLSTLTLAVALSTPALALADVDSPARGAASTEPTIHQIYEAANSGKLADAESMIDKVLKAHPASAKAHYVHAELLAREGKIAAAKSALSKAKELAPGLPFAEASAVEKLNRALEPAANTSTSTPARAVAPTAAPAPASQPSPSIPWVPIALIGLVVVGYLAFRRRAGPPAAAAAASWQQQPSSPAAPYGGYGPGANGPSGYAPGGYGPGGVAQAPGAPAPRAGMGLGSALATGAAVGLGAVVAEQAFRHFTHDRADSGDRSPSSAIDDGNARMGRSLGPGADPIPNADLGGNDFGIQDTGSWDSGSGGDGGGGSDDW